jgi:hypothetical protein
MSDEYPKLMFRGSDEITVCGAAEEAERKAAGFHAVGETFALDTGETVEPDPPQTFGSADDGPGDEPTEGPPDDQTHAKRSRKKK